VGVVDAKSAQGFHRYPRLCKVAAEHYTPDCEEGSWNADPVYAVLNKMPADIRRQLQSMRFVYVFSGPRIADLSALCATLQGLRELKIAMSAAEWPQVLQGLQHMPSLTSLDLGYVMGEGWEHLAQAVRCMKQLVTLTLVGHDERRAGEQATRALTRALPDAPALQTLTLKGVVATAAAVLPLLRAWRTHPRLHAVDLRDRWGGGLHKMFPQRAVPADVGALAAFNAEQQGRKAIVHQSCCARAKERLVRSTRLVVAHSCDHGPLAIPRRCFLQM
jgi:hypothetical protein